MKMDENRIRVIMDEALAKHRKGEKLKGPVDIHRDPRNFMEEIIEEYLDAIMYSIYEIQRLRNVDAWLKERLETMVKDNPLSIDHKKGG